MADPQVISADGILLTVVVSGKSTEVLISKEAPLGDVIPIALEQTGNKGQGPDRWELRDADGNELDLKKLVGEYNFPPEYRLFLNLKAGAGGER